MIQQLALGCLIFASALYASDDRICILDQRATPLDPSVIPAIQRQITDHFSPQWHVTARLYAAITPDQGDWYVILTDVLDRSALGRHGVDPDGIPYATVFGDGDTKTLSHEILEMLADPWVNRWTLTRHSWNLFEGEVFKHEICDPVSGSTYLIDGVRVSDFVYPSFYRAGSKGPWDYVGIVTAPLSNTAAGSLPATSIWSMDR